MQPVKPNQDAAAKKQQDFFSLLSYYSFSGYQGVSQSQAKI